MPNCLLFGSFFLPAHGLTPPLLFVLKLIQGFLQKIKVGWYNKSGRKAPGKIFGCHTHFGVT